MNTDGPEKHMLRGWTSVATRRLRQGGPEAWCIVDDAMGNHEEFVRNLRDELSLHSLTGRMTASRTAEDAKVSQLIDILRIHPLTSSQLRPPTSSSLSSETPPTQTRSIDTTDDPKSRDSSSLVRGDRSVFLGRNVIQAADFEAKYPCLSHLVRSVMNTVTCHVTTVAFDASMTSVQLAEYPGDGLSGYLRHFDRDGTMGHEPCRMITAIYYLTSDDWDVAMDGGCLRLFNAGGEPSQHIAPYSDRLVIFRSDSVEHQVLPSLRRPRLALTIWMYGRLSSGKTSSPPAIDANVAAVNLSSSVLAGPPPLPVDESGVAGALDATIFVSIPAYRDPETGPTLRNLMATARNPSRVFVGLVLQVDAASDNERRRILELLPTDQPWYRRQVRVLTQDARHAAGPCPARCLAQPLFRGEEYVLSIDSHMRFRTNWDVYLIQQWHACPRHRPAILSTYPVGYELPNRIPNETRGTVLEPWKFDDDGMFRQKSRFLSSDELSQATGPIRTHLFAAGFNFSRSSIVSDCPYQNLPYLFFGEESSMAVRLFVRGYDLYAPAESVCYHLWSRSYNPRSLNEDECNNDATVKEKQRRLRDESRSIVQAQLTRTGPHADSSSSAALVRDVASFGAAIGVDFHSRRILKATAHDGERQATESRAL